MIPPALQCRLFVNGTSCQSTPADTRNTVTEHVCQDLVLTGTVHATSAQNCTRVEGNVIIFKLDSSVSESSLSFLLNLRMIMGLLVVENNPGLFSLSFLQELLFVTTIVVKDNPNLMDATLPHLPKETVVLVQACPILCAMRYPVPFQGVTSCPHISLLFEASSNSSQDINNTLTSSGKVSR